MLRDKLIHIFFFFFTWHDVDTGRIFFREVCSYECSMFWLGGPTCWLTPVAAGKASRRFHGVFELSPTWIEQRGCPLFSSWQACYVAALCKSCAESVKHELLRPYRSKMPQAPFNQRNLPYVAKWPEQKAKILRADNPII